MTQTPTGKNRTISLKIPDDVGSAIDAAATRTGRDAATVASEMLAEAVRMRQHPGIVFIDGPNGRRAGIVGTEVEVASVIGKWNHCDGDWNRLRLAFPFVRDDQLNVALRYGKTYQDDIIAQLDADNHAIFEAFWSEHPETRPRHEVR